jgi:NAD(P)-dependent dehydrogenase (short-subunit alcohol dehydrogenase family)
MTITDRAVLVTGANRGIGQALVEEALRRGAKRVYAGTRQPLAHSDGRVTPLTLDVTSAAQTQAAAEKVESLDLLINNAGLALYDDLSDRAALEQHLAVNLFGTYRVTRAFLPLLTGSRGAIVNNLSLNAFAPLPLIPAYSISKAAAFSLSQSLRALLAGRGVRVHAVLTGPVDTDMTRGLDIPKASPESVSTGRDTVQLRHGQTAATAAALTATLGLAAASWVVAVRQMNGMDMGVATRLGSFAFFVALWVLMMTAMMLPGAAPAVLRRVHASGGVRAVPLFVGSYLAVWTVVGVAVYALYRPHGAFAAGVVTIAAGGYEFTPLKQHFRRRCRDSVRSGFEFGLCCVGSSIGLMLMLVALSVMSVTWMSVIAVLVLAQKLLPAKAAIDVPLALAIVGLGILIVIAPSSVPGLTPPM